MIARAAKNKAVELVVVKQNWAISNHPILLVNFKKKENLISPNKVKKQNSIHSETDGKPNLD